MYLSVFKKECCCDIDIIALVQAILFPHSYDLRAVPEGIIEQGTIDSRDGDSILDI